MKILLVNDDGIEAFGIKALAAELTRAHEVIVAAPDSEQSAKSHAITHGKNGLHYLEDSFAGGIRAYRIFGTPADCVKFACIRLGVEPEVVISGINHGNNLGSEILYSGTVSAACEGAYLGIPAIAVSCVYHSAPERFVEAAKFVASHLAEFLSLPLPPFCVLNINFPQGAPKGFVYTRMGVQLFNDAYELENEKYYLRGNPIGYGGNAPDCDVEWILKGYITVSPLKMDRTDDVALEKIRAASKGNGASAK